jgi:DNA-binding response OmpR family regulator
VIFDDEPAVRQVLGALCARRGYDVFTFPDPGLCPLYVMDRCPCPPGTVCADLLLSDLHMPEVQGLDFVESLLAKACVTPHIALMSAAWSAAAWARAGRLGCRLFTKPFASAEILAWFDTVQAHVAPTRVLLDWCGQGWRIEPPAPEDRGKPGPHRREFQTVEDRGADPVGPFGPWLVRRVAAAVQAGELPGHLLARLRQDLAGAEPTAQVGGDLLSVQEIAELAGVSVAQASETFAALQQVPGVGRERMRRRIAEAWLERQRRLYRDGESGG